MDALQCIRTRRSCRKFLQKPLEEKTLETILEAGRCAPTGGNTQQYHLIVITSKAVLDRLSSMVCRLFAQMEPREGMYSSLLNSIRLAKRGDYVFHYDPAALVIAANKRGYGNAMADCACVLENMMLAANALDVGSCWINQLHWLDSYSGATGEHPEMEEYLCSLGLGEDETVCGALSLGYADPLNRGDMTKRSLVTWVREAP